MLTGKTIGELTQLTSVDDNTKFLVEKAGTTYYSNYSNVVDGFATTGSNDFTGNQTVTGSFIVSGVTSDGTLTLQPDYSDSRTVQIYNTSPADVHIKGNAAETFFGDDTNYVKIDANADTVTINSLSGVTISGNTTISNNLGINGYLNVNAESVNYLPIHIISGATRFMGGQVDFMSGGTSNFHGSIVFSDDINDSYVQMIANSVPDNENGIGTLNITTNRLSVGYGSTKWVTPTISTLMVSGSMFLEPYDGDGSQTGSALPSGQRGSMAVSGSNLFFHNGTEWKAVTLT